MALIIAALVLPILFALLMAYAVLKVFALLVRFAFAPLALRRR